MEQKVGKCRTDHALTYKASMKDFQCSKLIGNFKNKILQTFKLNKLIFPKPET